MITSKLPDFPWLKWHLTSSTSKETYLSVLNYFFSLPEVIKLATTTTQGLINVLHSIFVRHGIPDILSDNGFQESSQEIKDFPSPMGFSTSLAIPTTQRITD